MQKKAKKIRQIIKVVDKDKYLKVCSYARTEAVYNWHLTSRNSATIIEDDAPAVKIWTSILSSRGYKCEIINI